jgi:ABC-type transporter Mla subunit MlaD
MSAIADQLLALAQHTGAPDVVEDAAILIRSLEGVRAERDVLQEIVDEQRAQIAKLVERIVELTEEVSSVTEDRRHAVAALSEQVDTVRAERDRARRLVCELQCDPPERFIGVPHEVAQMYGWDCFPEVTR